MTANMLNFMMANHCSNEKVKYRQFVQWSISFVVAIFQLISKKQVSANALVIYDNELIAKSMQNTETGHVWILWVRYAAIK